MGDKSTLEAAIENYFVAEVEAMGGLALKLRPPTGRGFPDRTILLSDMPPIFVEFKRPVGGKVAAHQYEWREKIKQAGAAFYFVQDRRVTDHILNSLKHRVLA